MTLPVSGVPAGQILVPSGFVHPVRGRVRCPAAPAVAASAGASPWRVRQEEPGSVLPGSAGTDLLFTVSYLDQAGAATGIAAAAAGGDPAARHAARDLVENWASALRTRRVLVSTAEPGCTGAACRLLPAAGHTVRRFLERGDAVLCVGPGGTTLAGTVPVATVSDARRLTGFLPDRLSFVIAPGAAVEEAMPVLAALRERFPRLRGQHPDEFCYAASDQREALRSVAAASDLLLVCGTANAADNGKLATWTRQTGRPTRWIDKPTRLRAEWLAPAATVGIVAAAPSAGPVVDDVLANLAGLGPLSIVRRAVTSTVLGESAGHAAVA